MRTGRQLIGMVAVVFALALLSGAEAQQDTKSLEGKPAPAFSLQTLSGKDMKLSDEKGNVVVLDFWATWCPPCRASLPHLQAIYDDKDLAAKGLKVYAVNLREEKKVAQDYCDHNKLSFPVPLDKVGGVAQKYLVHGIPTTVIVGRDGKISKVFVGFGPGSEEKLRTAIDHALEAAKAQDKT